MPSQIKGQTASACTSTFRYFQAQSQHQPPPHGTFNSQQLDIEPRISYLVVKNACNEVIRFTVRSFSFSFMIIQLGLLNLILQHELNLSFSSCCSLLRSIQLELFVVHWNFCSFLVMILFWYLQYRDSNNKELKEVQQSQQINCE
ncbi:Hypothetical_protein [Hexamita inflata]|uniref:Hypothetical_protein n=1 Tax=Hexamita inflata TaxID=28002 RepID=A0AA86UHV0_9EUKA|nr:Hypothetical protein HINF_LOCUS28353 [Hexamita inflata]